jgi:hypothetical protein
VACHKYDVCSKLLLKRDYGGDVTTCIAYGTALCNGPEKPAAGLMPAMLSACNDEIVKSTCADFLASALPSCRLTGSRANGARCAFSKECQSGRCVGGDDGQCGTCGGIASAGGACQRRRDCAPGLVCNSMNLCAPPIAMAGKCAGSSDCQKGFFCSGSTCAPLATKGSDKCEPDGCDLDQELICHDTKQVCVAVELARAGQECGTFENKVILCAAGTCPKPTGTATHGICPTVVAEGQPCTAETLCAPSTSCSQGTCRKVPPPSCM